MKKLIRLFVIIFCLFFLLQAMPGSFLPAFRTFLHRAVQVGSDATLLIAREIDDLTGYAAQDPDRSQPDGAGQTGKENGPRNAGSPERADDDAGGADPEKNEAPENQAAPAEEDAAEREEEDHKRAAEEDRDGTEKDDDRTGTDDKTEDSDPEDAGAGTGENAVEPDIFYYYYTRISKEERLLYDAMLALALDSDPASDGENSKEESRLISLNPAEEAFAESYTRAYNALVTDHPELFWISQGRARYECRYYVLPSFGGKFKVVLSLEFSSEDDARAGFAEEERQLEEAAKALLSEVDLTQSEAAVALRIHDLLIDAAWYNTDAGADDYAHTAYGALVQDSMGNPGGALCDGYALAYEYLLQRAGLTCTMVCGYAGASEEENEKHAWNLVMLDDDWYEVDATWDDLDFLLSPSNEGYDLLLEALSDETYMQRIRHYMFNLTTEQIRSFTPGDEYRYVSYRGWVTLLQPSVHIRFTEEEAGETRDYVTPLAPDAFGTWYTWDMLTGNE